ncbi:hypothetical protein DAI22_03g355800 [Oryza sativa Japonica Group]|nr:hypothetical protein DAI22_03g355800 [Oryza sativa Japonica Group]
MRDEWGDLGWLIRWVCFFSGSKLVLAAFQQQRLGPGPPGTSRNWSGPTCQCN